MHPTVITISVFNYFTFHSFIGNAYTLLFYWGMSNTGKTKISIKFISCSEVSPS